MAIYSWLQKQVSLPISDCQGTTPNSIKIKKACLQPVTHSVEDFVDAFTFHRNYTVAQCYF